MKGWLFKTQGWRFLCAFPPCTLLDKMSFWSLGMTFNVYFASFLWPLSSESARSWICQRELLLESKAEGIKVNSRRDNIEPYNGIQGSTILLNNSRQNSQNAPGAALCDHSLFAPPKGHISEGCIPVRMTGYCFPKCRFNAITDLRETKRHSVSACHHKWSGNHYHLIERLMVQKWLQKFPMGQLCRPCIQGLPGWGWDSMRRKIYWGRGNMMVYSLWFL